MNVNFFVTCIGDALKSRMARDSVLLLEKLGCRVNFPEKQGCCGQPAINSGYIKEAIPGMKNLIAALEDNDDPIISPAAFPFFIKTVDIHHKMCGYKGEAMHMARYIRLFHNLGYNVLAPDDRASGQSQGKYITFGWPDRLDYVKWIKQVIAKKGSDSQIGLFGVSMGGATVMMVSGERLPKQVKAIVEDCGYSSIESELSEQLKQQFNLPKEPMITAARIMGTIRVGYDFGKGSSTKQLEKNKLPIFFIHGDSDTFVPTKMVYENYKATSAPKKLWVTKNTGHANSYNNHPKEYQKRVNEFFNKYLK